MKKTTHPSWAKAHRLVDLSGTAEAVPFPKAMQEVTSKNIKLKVTLSLVKSKKPGWLKLTNKTIDQVIFY